MDTITGRKKIGFPEDRGSWANAPAVYDAHTLRIAAHPVMEDWEASYMHRLAKIACGNGGRILEVGYGMGLSARAIQAHAIDKHYVIECHPDVVARCMRDFHGPMADSRLHLLSGFWQDLTPLFKDDSFDGILFDTYPMSADELHCNHFPFFSEAYRLLRPGGIFTYYSDESASFSPLHLSKLKAAGFADRGIGHDVCEVDPPAGCQYWRHKTILAPIIRK